MDPLVVPLAAPLVAAAVAQRVQDVAGELLRRELGGALEVDATSAASTAEQWTSGQSCKERLVAGQFAALGPAFVGGALKAFLDRDLRVDFERTLERVAVGLGREVRAVLLVGGFEVAGSRLEGPCGLRGDALEGQWQDRCWRGGAGSGIHRAFAQAVAPGLTRGAPPLFFAGPHGPRSCWGPQRRKSLKARLRRLFSTF